jgi:Na+-driven multidrug efflux pump
MGASGAAASLAAIRWFECILLVSLVYVRRSPASGSMRELRAVTRSLARRVLATAWPVMAGELLWALAITMFSRTYAFIGTDSLAAANFGTNVEHVVMAPFVGLMFAGGTMIGNRIGADEEGHARVYARWLVWLTVGCALVLGLGLWMSRDWLLALYGVSEATLAHARVILGFASLLLVARTLNMILFVGILRPGGDTRFLFVLDTAATWLVGVLPAHVGAVTFGLPVEWVYLLAMTNEVVKVVICLHRFRYGPWMRNLVR